MRRFISLRFASILLGFFSAISINAVAHATPEPGPGEFRICLKTDMTGFVDLDTGTRATATEQRLWGINYRLERYGVVLQNWTYTDADDGCFLVDDGAGTFVVKVRPRSTFLEGANTVRVNDPNGNLKTFAVTTPFIGTSQTTYEVIFPDKALLRMYSIATFMIERAFGGWYGSTDLYIWKNGTPPCTTVVDTVFCADGSDGHIRIQGEHEARKFVLAHEYGHVNMHFSVGSRLNRCDIKSIDDDPMASPPPPSYAHRLQGRERSSCAAVEGFAHFVSGDVFNWHNSGVGSGDPRAEVHSANDQVWDLGVGVGGCATYPLDGLRYPSQNRLRQYVDCSPGTSEPTDSTEMDWARLWWDYHEDSGLTGLVRSHIQLQSELIVAGPWGTGDAYGVVKAGLSPIQAVRWIAAANYNGACDGSSC